MNDHLTAQQMLSYLDGELSRTLRKDVEKHMHSCWTCRSELERLKADIATILDAHREAFVPGLPPSPRTWTPIETLLMDPPPEYGWLRLRAYLGNLFGPVRAVAFATAVVVLSIGAYSMLRTQTVSAKEALQKVRTVDDRRNSIRNDQVIRQRVQVSRRARGKALGKTGSIDTWKSAKATYWEVQDDSVGAELEAEYQSHSIPEGLPLSASAVDLWGKVTGSNPVLSEEGGDLAVTFASPSQSRHDSVERVSLLIQPQTWQIHELILDFVDASFEVREDDFAILPSTAVPVPLLAYLDLNTVTAPNTNSPHTIATPISHPPTDPEKVELDVLSTLHRLKADLGEPVTVTRSAQGVEVGLWRVPQDRRTELQTALEGQPGVHLELFEAPLASKKRAIVSATVLQTSSGALLDVTPESDAQDERLLKFFGSVERERGFSSTALSSSTAILSHLYALRGLQERFPPTRERALTADEQSQLHGLIQDHVTAVVTLADAMSQQFGPLNASFHVVAEPQQERATTFWQQEIKPALDTSRSLDHSLRAMLTANQTPMSADAALPQINLDLAALRIELRQINPAD